MNRLLIWLALTLAAPVAWGEQPVADAGLAVVEAQPVAIGERIRFHSQILQDDVTMDIYLPASHGVASEDHTYPVIFVNGGHGEQFFMTLAGIVKHLADRERMPESIVVSLNDMGDIPKIFSNGMWGRDIIGGHGDPQASLRHLAEEVIPYLEKTYRANNYRMIIGVSGSCLFPIYTFTHAPELFRSHVLVAAADVVGMGYQKERTFIDEFEAALNDSPQRRGTMYLGVADSDLDGEPEYQANLDDLTARLGQHERFDLKVEVVPNADHYAVFIDAVLSAFDQNFPFDRWSSRYRELVAQPGDALENIDRYYAELSREVGFVVLPRAERWNNVNSLEFMTRHLIRQERPLEAVAVAQRRIAYRPRVPDAYRGLADAYEAVGDIDRAIEAQGKAVALAKLQGSADREGLEKRLDALRQVKRAAVGAKEPAP